jgi:hypothetical protein
VAVALLLHVTSKGCSFASSISLMERQKERDRDDEGWFVCRSFGEKNKKNRKKKYAIVWIFPSA